MKDFYYDLNKTKGPCIIYQAKDTQ
jgi:hypothetical protein